MNIPRDGAGMALPFFDYSAHLLDQIVRPGMLCAFDFDGTLAPLVRDPERAGIPASILCRLIALAEHVHVAVVTGRSLEDIGMRLDFLPDFVVGNHGIEGLPDCEQQIKHYEALCREWYAALSDALRRDPVDDGDIWVESKTYSLSVHYRLAHDRAGAEARLTRLFAKLIPSARVIAGKCVFNLLPPDAPDKGVALQRLIQLSGAQTAIYVGDDIGDEEVFRLKRPELMTVKIGPATGSAADFFLKRHVHVGQLLDELIARLDSARR